MQSIVNLFDEKGIVGLVLQGSGITYLVLITLLLMSSLSWAIIILKWIQFRRISGENDEFIQIFNKEAKLDQIYNLAQQFQHAPFARVFEVCYREITSFRDKVKSQQTKYRSSKEILDRLNLRLSRTSDQCINQQYAMLNHRLNPLASVSSSAPFIGLFGTVLGIIDAFQGIGVSGVTSLAVVAPGISEALIATAAGLLAAIPALIAYNYFRSAARSQGEAMRNFSLELNNRMEWVVS
ncbi:MAG: MotA/TolQ/ExbB proton channel family protein [SAR324 cluster bacterium]|nr:MotA/TolQ/ExbB proton channel family protein [SAR324 cluster bacterium]